MSAAALRVALVAVGCRVNQAEIDGLAAAFAARGWRTTDDTATAELVVLNTCAVTGGADSDGRKLIRRIHRANPHARIVVTGCQAQREPVRLGALEGVSLVAGNAAKHRIPEWAHELAIGEAVRFELPPVEDPGRFDLEVGERRARGCARPLVKIQDGCDRSCTFCVIPGARGSSRSLEPDRVLDELRALGRLGYAEAVLSGIDLGSWGKDLEPAIDLAALLDRIARERPSLRVRLSSLDPRDLSERLAERLASYGWICPHLHVSLQTGSPEVHRRMGRGRWPEGLEERLLAIAGVRSRFALGLDVMTAFPGETEADHGATAEWIRAMPVTYLHVFPYSPRPGTPAHGWAPVEAPSFSSPLAQAVAKERAGELRELGGRLRLAFHQLHIGQVVDAVAEERRGDLVRGTSERFVAVEWAARDDALGRLVPVRVESAELTRCHGSAA